MRFIWNFIFFGIIYYLIWRFFPVVIETFTTWMDSLYDVIRDLVMMAVDKVSNMGKGPGN
ncbi:MAG: hypothetical protein WB791_03975 [Waddliaceae bacterium]